MTIEAVTLDFADTLYPHRPRELDRILEGVADYLQTQIGTFDFANFRTKHLEIRARQFAENRPTLHENDIAARMRETILHLAPNVGEAEQVEEWVQGCLEAYGQAFEAVMVMPPYLPDVFAQLSERFPLAVISNYPLSAPIVRTLERDGLTRYLQAVIVSADVGYVKPHPLIFQTALSALRSPSPANVVHVGDDWDADVIGAGLLGLQTVYTHQWRDVTDAHYKTGNVTPLAEIRDLRELPTLLERFAE